MWNAPCRKNKVASADTPAATDSYAVGGVGGAGVGCGSGSGSGSGVDYSCCFDKRELNNFTL